MGERKNTDSQWLFAVVQQQRHCPDLLGYEENGSWSCHKKGIDMIQLGCTLPNLANICLHKSTSAKFHSFRESNKDLQEKIRWDMVRGPSIVFNGVAVVDETLIRMSANSCKSIVGIDASQLYPNSMCQLIATGLYTSFELDEDLQRFKHKQEALKIRSCLTTNQTRV